MSCPLRLRCTSPQAIEIPNPRVPIPKPSAGLCKSRRAQRPAELGRSRRVSVAWSARLGDDGISKHVRRFGVAEPSSAARTHACQANLHPEPSPAPARSGHGSSLSAAAGQWLPVWRGSLRPPAGNIPPKGACHEGTRQLHAREGTMAVSILWTGHKTCCHWISAVHRLRELPPHSSTVPSTLMARARALDLQQARTLRLLGLGSRNRKPSLALPSPHYSLFGLRVRSCFLATR